MTEPWPTTTAPRTTASTPVFLTTFGLIIAATAAFLVIDLWIARIDSRESTLHAAHLYEDGEALLASGKAKDAADHFASAQALERSNVRYGVAFAEALLADGRLDEAESQLRGVLGRAEADGVANLVMARILVRRGRLGDAIFYYHRAIYGIWAGDAMAQRLRARLELIDLLARRDARRELLAELLPLQETDPDSVALRRRVGHLFVVAGSPERGIPIFRDLLRRDPNDGDAYAGMGEAALALGNFRTARADLQIAARLLPDSGRVAALLQVADTVVAIDPTARGIGVRARAERSRTFLALTLAATEPCLHGGQGRQLADSARAVLSAAPNRTAPSEDGEMDARLDLASALWAARGTRCPTAAGPTGQALAWLHARLP